MSIFWRRLIFCFRYPSKHERELVRWRRSLIYDGRMDWWDFFLEQQCRESDDRLAVRCLDWLGSPPEDGLTGANAVVAECVPQSAQCHLSPHPAG